MIVMTTKSMFWTYNVQSWVYKIHVIYMKYVSQYNFENKSFWSEFDHLVCSWGL